MSPSRAIHEIPLEGEAGQQLIEELVEIGTKSRDEVLKILSENGPIEF